MNKKITVTFNLNENNLKKAQNFFAKYDLVSMLGDSKTKFFLGKETKRVCRFCNKTDKEVTFKKDAHVIPEFMGNHKLLSYFECDSCNDLFAKYEDSFANFMGISRTISQIKGKKNKIPKYKDPRTGLEMKITDKGMHMSSIEGTDVFEIDEENKTFLLRTKRPGYIPIHIPKLIIKVGFCMLLDSELNDFEITRKFIIENNKDSRFKDINLLRVFGYYIPGPTYYQQPFIQLYQRKAEKSEENIPLYQLLFYYANYQFQMTLPFGKADDHLQGQKVDLPIAPLLIDNSYLEEFGQEIFFNLNLSSSEKKSGEDHNITFSYKGFTDTNLKK